MRPPRRFIAVSTVLALITLFAGCASTGGHRPPPAATIEFDNQSPDPVRVYLVVENGGEFLLGRVYPMQSNFLRVPRHLPESASGRISLIVVPLGEGGYANRLERGPYTRELIATMPELTVQRFVITPLALHGVFGARHRLP